MKISIQHLFFFAAATCLSLSTYAGEGHDHAGHGHGDHVHAEPAAEEQAPASARGSGLAGDDHAGHGGADDHGHPHAKVIAGPNGGRVLTKVEPHLEFLLKEDRRVQISALDADGEVIPVTNQDVEVYTGDRANPTRLRFTLKESVLVSDIPVPDGNGLPVVVRIKTDDPGSRVTEKFNLTLSACPGCSYKEYACICDHH